MPPSRPLFEPAPPPLPTPAPRRVVAPAPMLPARRTPMRDIFRGDTPADRPTPIEVTRPVTGPTAPPTPAARGDARAFWRRAASFESGPEDRAHPYRIAVAWRMARYFLRLTKEDVVGETLAEALERTGAWLEAAVQELQPTTKGGRPKRDSGLLRLISGAIPAPGEASPAPTLGIRPPRVPSEFVDIATQEVSPAYDPTTTRDDGPLYRWLMVFEDAIRQLGLRNGTPNDADAGAIGLKYLTDPWMLRMFWPSQDEVEILDDVVRDRVKTFLVERGVDAAAKWLRDEYGLLPIETKEVIAAARRELVDYHSATTDEARAILVARIEKVIEAATEASDNRSLLAALKLLSIIQGVAQAQERDEDKQFLNTAYEVKRTIDTTEQQAKALTTSDFEIIS